MPVTQNTYSAIAVSTYSKEVLNRMFICLYHKFAVNQKNALSILGWLNCERFPIYRYSLQHCKHSECFFPLLISVHRFHSDFYILSTNCSVFHISLVLGFAFHYNNELSNLLLYPKKEITHPRQRMQRTSIAFLWCPTHLRKISIKTTIVARESHDRGFQRYDRP